MKFSKIILDTNFFILFIIGKIDIRLIPKISKLSAYKVDDFNLLMNFVRKADEMIITNSIITEVCNHLDKDNRRYNNEIFKQTNHILKFLSDGTIKLNENINSDSYIVFGFTDSEIFNIADNKTLILTDDFKLCDYLSSKGKLVLNIDNLRQGLWFS